MFVVQAAVVKGQGGIATAVGHYERMFRAVGVGSVVVFSGPSAQKLRDEGFDVIDAPRLLTSPIGVVLALFDDLKRALVERAKGQPIIVIAHSDLALASLRRMLPGARFATPCHSDKFKRKRGADLVVTLNGAQQALMCANLAGQRVARLGNPYVAPPAETPVLEGPARLNFVARFIATKDPLTLLRAIPLIKGARPGLRFIGAGELDTQLRETAAALEIEADFAGWRTAPFSLFHRGDILVLPSQWEGLPYLLQEALDHGVPVIAADNAGNRAALGDGAYGMLFPFGDAAALAACAETALAQLDALRAKAENGRAALRRVYGAEPFWAALTRELGVTANA